MRGIPLAVVLVVGLAAPAQALEVGDRAPDFSLPDVNGKIHTLASFQKRIVAIWYEGKSSFHQNTWLNAKLRELRDAGQLPYRHYQPMGIANYQETAVPNAVIDLMIRREARRLGSLVLCDKTGVMMRTWGFRNGRSNIYVLDADRRLVWKSSGPLEQRRARQFIRFLQRSIR
jgi:predicted transcriptional regulator